jgi:hypothetical protein
VPDADEIGEPVEDHSQRVHPVGYVLTFASEPVSKADRSIVENASLQGCESFWRGLNALGDTATDARGLQKGFGWGSSRLSVLETIIDLS